LSNATSRTILSTKSKQIEHVQILSTLSKGRDFTEKLVRHCCRSTLSKKSSTSSSRQCRFDTVAGVGGA